MALLCKRRQVRFKVKTHNSEWKGVSFGSRSRSVRDHADTAGSDQLFTIIAGKFGILWPYTNLSSCPTSSSTACRRGSATQKPCLLGALGFSSSKGNPILTFSVKSWWKSKGGAQMQLTLLPHPGSLVLLISPLLSPPDLLLESGLR